MKKEKLSKQNRVLQEKTLWRDDYGWFLWRYGLVMIIWIICLAVSSFFYVTNYAFGISTFFIVVFCLMFLYNIYQTFLLYDSFKDYTRYRKFFKFHLFSQKIHNLNDYINYCEDDNEAILNYKMHLRDLRSN